MLVYFGAAIKSTFVHYFTDIPYITKVPSIRFTFIQNDL